MAGKKTIDFGALANDLLSRGTSLLYEWFPDGVIDGSEFCIGDLAGEAGKSLRVNTRSGKWCDFATGHKGGDLISLYAAIHQITQGQAVRRLFPNSNSPGGAAPDDIGKPPTDALAPSMEHSRYGKPVASWVYRSDKAAPLFYVARYEPPNDRKQYIPWGWSLTKKTFVPKLPPAPLALFNLDRLAARPEAPVCIVEGEKAADAATRLLPQYAVTTWQGGSKSHAKTDFSPLHGRKILLWPDNDEPGHAAMKSIGTALSAHCPSIRTLNVTDKPAGWDAADFTGPQDDFLAWAKANVANFTPAAAPVASVDETQTALAKHEQPPIPTDCDPMWLPFNDGGNVERLYHWFANDYIYTTMGWWRWNGKIWVDDAQGDFYLEVITKFQGLRNEARAREQGLEGEDLKAAKSVTSYFNSCCNMNRIKAMTELAKARFKKADTVFDANPDLFNFENGTMNLRTGQLQPFSREDYITKTAHYAIDTQADCPNFKKLICEAMGQDDGKTSFLIQVLGSALSGNVKDQIIVLNHGAGSNGKSTLFDHVMLRVMGDYGKAINIKSFLDSRASREIGPRPDLIALVGVRYGTMSEPPTGSAFDEALLKSFTGGDSINCRDLHKGVIEFTPCLHLVVSYNLEPRLKDFSDGMRRRFKKIEWSVQFQKNESFKEALDAEIPAIAWFLVQACRQWYERGLEIPESVVKATSDYFYDENPVAQFVDECLEVSDGFSLSNSDLWAAWETACEQNGWDTKSKRYLSQGLQLLGFRQSPGRAGGRRWERLSVKRLVADDDWRVN